MQAGKRQALSARNVAQQLGVLLGEVRGERFFQVVLLRLKGALGQVGELTLVRGRQAVGELHDGVVGAFG